MSVLISNQSKLHKLFCLSILDVFETFYNEHIFLNKIKFIKCYKILCAAN